MFYKLNNTSLIVIFKVLCVINILVFILFFTEQVLEGISTNSSRYTDCFNKYWQSIGQNDTAILTEASSGLFFFLTMWKYYMHTLSSPLVQNAVFHCYWDLKTQMNLLKLYKWHHNIQFTLFVRRLFLSYTSV